MVFPILPVNTLSGGYNIANSLRSNQPDGAYLSFAVSSPNTDIFTVSMWLKIVYNEASTTFFEIGKALTGEIGDYTTFQAHISWGRTQFDSYDGVAGGFNIRWGAPAFYHRDDSAWYHIVMRMDSSQNTLANRARFYINGEDISSRLTKTVDPDQNDDYFPATGSSVYFPGGVSYTGANIKFDGHIAECAYIDGTSYAASTFAETDEDSGIWKPKDFKDDVTFGTNGLYLEFKQSGTGTNSSGLGADTSGNDNHMAVTNFVATDQTTDTPTNNFATLNPLDPNRYNDTSEGNTQYVSPTSAREQIRSTFGLTSGKWYWETKPTTANGGLSVGVLKENVSMTLDDSLGKDAYGWSYDSGGSSRHSNSSTSSGFDTYTTNDIIGVALDLDDHEIFFYKNGTAQNSGNKAFDLDTGETYFAACGSNTNGSTETFQVNFGNAPFTISSGNADARGYGNFEYAVPSGYYALCTKNLAIYG
jgi:hypothetical protein